MLKDDSVIIDSPITINVLVIQPASEVSKFDTIFTYMIITLLSLVLLAMIINTLI